jgi:hypothetical protein
MKKNTNTVESNLRYVPYGINGEYFVYDNKENNVPIGQGMGFTKKKAKAVCDELNEKESSNVVSGNSVGDAVKLVKQGDDIFIAPIDERAAIARVFNNNYFSAEANAALIVEAVNNYTKIKEVAKEMLDNLEHLSKVVSLSDFAFTPENVHAKSLIKKAKDIL